MVTTLKVPVTHKDHIRGNEKALITLLEYGDYECPYCRVAHPVIKAVQHHFGEDMRFVFRHFPLSQIHPHAQMAAETAEMADAHQRFWEMHDLIYNSQERLSVSRLAELALTLGFSAADLNDAFKNPVYQAKIRGDFMSGVRSGVNGTPTFFINGRRYNGLHEFDDLVSAIDQLAPNYALL